MKARRGCVLGRTGSYHPDWPEGSIGCMGTGPLGWSKDASWPKTFLNKMLDEYSGNSRAALYSHFLFFNLEANLSSCSTPLNWLIEDEGCSSFETARDRLVRDLRMAGVETLEQANRCLETEFIPWWNQTLAVAPAEPQDAPRPLEKSHHLEAILSHVETRKIKTDYSFQFAGRQYVIERSDIRTGLRGA
jgi:hypothetical protein